MLKSIGPRIDPCETLVFISNVLESISSNMPHCFLLYK